MTANREYKKTTLGNGLRLMTAAMPHTRAVSVCIFVGTGSRCETAAQSGISHFIEHLLFKGTGRRPAPADICGPVEGVGGALNGGTDKELTIYWSKVPQPHFPEALDILTDMLLNSRLDSDDIEKERQVIIEEINMSLDSPSQRVGMLIDELLWPGQPLGRDIAGSRESVAAIDRPMLADYLARQYQPGNTVVSVAGDISPGEVADMVGRAAEGWKQRNPPPAAGEPYREAPFRRVLVEKRDTEQVQLCLALPGVSLTHPDRFRLDILNIILGEGMSSRLFTEIRDKLGLAYSIQSYSEHFLDTGALTISAGVDTRNVEMAVRAILEEVSRLKEPVAETELAKAKELYKGRLLLRLEDSRSVVGWMGSQEVLTGRVLGIDEVVAMIDAITTDELRRLAGERLVGDKLRLAAVGPVAPDAPLEDLLKL